MVCHGVFRLVRFTRFIMGAAFALTMLAPGADTWAASVAPEHAVASAGAVGAAAFPGMHRVPGLEEPLVATGPVTAADDQAVRELIAAYRIPNSGERDGDYRSRLDGFLTEHPDSVWRAAILTNLGLSDYHAGYFSRAIAAWTDAWAAGRTATEPRARAVADRALGELLRMHARLGHADQLAALLDDLGDRELSGQASEALAGAREGLWSMRHNPGIAYLCGPMALKNLLLARGASDAQVSFLDTFRSGPQGVSLRQVAHLAERAGLAYRLVRREPGTAIPVPAIVHWKLSHFAAVVGEANGRYQLKDPTFGRDLWVTRDALEAESSGYFLIPTAQQPDGFRAVSLAEANKIRGMGNTGSNMSEATTPDDQTAQPPPPPESCGSHGMCRYSFTEMVVSLRLKDTPVGYRPPKGAPLFFTLTYNQREATQPANFSYFNVGPRWSLNWLSYIVDDPALPGASVSRAVAGGGGKTYAGYNSTTGAFLAERKNGAVLVRTQGAPITYERRLPDGSVEVYAQGDGAAVYPRRIFLTRRIDPAGNTVELAYDGQLRLTSVTDATGRVTTLDYSRPDWPLVVTRVTDPFGRSALLDYDLDGRLTAITDVLGLTSSFVYNTASQITSLTTPYGTTQFRFGGDGNARYLEATDPLGYIERLEYRHNPPGVASSDPSSLVPTGVLGLVDNYLNYRNTIYWDKNAYQLGAGIYTKGRIKHWTHLTSSLTSDLVESIKNPLESRIWYSYPGQVNTINVGTLDKPNRAGRVLDDGTTQLYQYSYNALGNVTSATDPAGRVTLYDYAANQIDRVAVRQQTGAGTYATLASVTYNAQHRPLTVTDAAGQTTTYTYNAAGQVLTQTNALNQVTTWTYDALGYLLQVQNPDGSTRESYTYDAYGRVASRTDSEGHTLTFAYDALDRLTQVGYPDGSAELTTYDKLDVASRTDRLGRTTTYTYDAVRNLTAETDPAGRITRYGYDGDGRLIRLTDPDGNLTTWERDLQGRVTAKVYADGSRETYAYEARTSRLQQRTDSLGQIASRSYTQDDRPATLTYGNAVNATPTVNFAYDAYFPRVTGMTDGNGSTAYQYVAPGAIGALRLASEDGPFANDDIAYTYDALGRVQSRTLDTVADTYAYDVLGRLIDHATPLAEFAYAYLGATDQRTRRSVVGNAVASCPGSVRNEHAAEQNTCTGVGHAYGIQRRTAATLVTTWQYDDNLHDRRLTGITHLDGGAPAGTWPRSYAYVTDAGNRLLAQTESLGSPSTRWSYGYDPADRLTDALATPGGAYAYTLDDADNLLNQQTPAGTASSTYNTLNQIVQRNGQLRTHDAAGNLTDDGTHTYAWDAEQRLIRIGYTGTTRSTEFRYDGLGRRTAVIENDGTTATETRYLWCGERICQARDGADTVIRRYYAEGELAVAATGDVAAFYAEDHLGSIRDLRMGDGQVLAAYDYDPYGNPTRVSETGGVRADYRYAGLFQHAPSGLYLTHYRVYDPVTARWISRDPIGEAGGVNLYGYVANEPVSRIDPRGLYWTRQPWQTPGVVGRPGTPVVPGSAISEAIEQYVPAGYTFGQMHDLFVEHATGAGYPDRAVNIPSMPWMYGFAVLVEILRAQGILPQPVNTFDLGPDPC